MIDKITLHDDEQGPFIYERLEGSDWEWRPHFPTAAGGREGKTFPSNHTITGDELLYLAALAIVPRSVLDSPEESGETP